MKKLGRMVRNVLLISIPTVLISFIIIELGFRLFVDVSDMQMRNVYNYETDLFQFEPNMIGRVITPAWTASYRINAQGWNSHRDYSPEKQSNETRFAIIGDSQIVAAMVDYDKQIAPNLEQLLSDEKNTILAYNFGVWGAPLTQYLAMMRYASETYQPDIYVIVIIRNDFAESWRDLAPDRWYFWQLGLDDDNEIYEIHPTPFESNTSRQVFRAIVPHSAVLRYLMYNLDFLTWFASQDNQAIPVDQESPTTTTNVAIEDEKNQDAKYQELTERLIRYALNQYQEVAASTDSQLLLVMDTDRAELYQGIPIEEWPNYNRYNVLIAQVAEEYGIPYIDLTETFVQDYAENGIRFDFELDGHWNVYAHALIAQTVAEKVTEQSWLDK